MYVIYFVYLCTQFLRRMSEASIKLAEMTVTKVGPSAYANAYKYHIRLVFTDSNQKRWTLDKDMDVYAMWIDCDRSGAQDVNMDPQPFVLESGNHNPQQEEGIDIIDSSSSQGKSGSKLILHNGHLFILHGNKTYTTDGRLIH